jgi:hypothetical protein
MSQKETEALHDLFTTFQVEALGQGDANLGANVLASMLGVLANLAPTDRTILTRDHRPARLGVNLLISGSASSGQVLDEVITEVGRRQRNFAANLDLYVDGIKEQSENLATLPPMEPGSNLLMDDFAETQSEIEPFFASRTEIWSRILNEVPTEQLSDLYRRPKFLVTAARPGDLENQLQGLRPGHPLVHLGLGKPADLAELSDPGAALVEGRFTVGTRCETVCANLLITDPMQMLGEAAKAPDDRTAWLRHFLWLCDGEAGPQAPTSAQAPDVPETTTERFRRALDNVIIQRLNLPEKNPTILDPDTRRATVRWTAFLREMEPRLPGISGAARNLIASLVFGLGEMARIEKRLSFSTAGVEAFARFLVRRMANARTMVLHAGEVAQRRSQIERVYRKLEQGPAEPRKIYRNLNRLSARDCDECLRWMEQAGISRRIGNQRELVVGARLNFHDCSTPLLEVKEHDAGHGWN